MGKLFATTVKLQKHRRKRKQPQNTFLAAAAAASNFFVFVFLLFFCFFFACFTCFSCTARFALLFTRQCCCFSHLFGHHSSLLATAGFPKWKTTKRIRNTRQKCGTLFLQLLLLQMLLLLPKVSTCCQLTSTGRQPWSSCITCRRLSNANAANASVDFPAIIFDLIHCESARKMHWESDRWCNANC